METEKWFPAIWVVCCQPSVAWGFGQQRPRCPQEEFPAIAFIVLAGCRKYACHGDPQSVTQYASKLARRRLQGVYPLLDFGCKIQILQFVEERADAVSMRLRRPCWLRCCNIGYVVAAAAVLRRCVRDNLALGLKRPPRGCGWWQLESRIAAASRAMSAARN